MIIYIPVILMAYIGGYSLYKVNKIFGIVIPVTFLVIFYIYLVSVGDLNV